MHICHQGPRMHLLLQVIAQHLVNGVIYVPAHISRGAKWRSLTAAADNVKPNAGHKYFYHLLCDRSLTD